MVTGCAKERNKRQEMLRPLEKDTLLVTLSPVTCPTVTAGTQGCHALWAEKQEQWLWDGHWELLNSLMAAPNTPPSTGKGLASPSRPFRLGHLVKVGARLAQALLVSKCNQQYRMSQSATCNVTLHHPVVSQWGVLCSTGTHCQEQKENIVSYFQLLHLCVALLWLHVPGLPRQAVPTLAGRGGAVDAALGTGTCHH